MVEMEFDQVRIITEFTRYPLEKDLPYPLQIRVTGLRGLFTSCAMTQDRQRHPRDLQHPPTQVTAESTLNNLAPEASVGGNKSRVQQQKRLC